VESNRAAQGAGVDGLGGECTTMRFNAEHWRQRALEARNLASGVQDREVRHALLRIADDYMARARERALAEMASGAPRPAERRLHDALSEPEPAPGGGGGRREP
jgi:hypothetical protein